MHLDRGEFKRLQNDYWSAFDQYAAEVQKTLDLLMVDCTDLAAVAAQRAAEAEAFERYRTAMKAYADSLWRVPKTEPELQVA